MQPLIMIADDAMFMRRVIRRALEQGGYDRFIEVSDGVEALRRYQEQRPDLVLLDITMPERSGLETLEDILNYDPEAKVVMCSAVGQEPVISQAIGRGACNFIVKPFKPEELLKLVEASL